MSMFPNGLNDPMASPLNELRNYADELYKPANEPGRGTTTVYYI
jgi:hypothetical protein